MARPGYCHYADLVYDVLLEPAREAILPREALRWGKLAQDDGLRSRPAAHPGRVLAELERTWVLSKKR